MLYYLFFEKLFYRISVIYDQDESQIFFELNQIYSNYQTFFNKNYNFFSNQQIKFFPQVVLLISDTENSKLIINSIFNRGIFGKENLIFICFSIVDSSILSKYLNIEIYKKYEIYVSEVFPNYLEDKTLVTKNLLNSISKQDLRFNSTENIFNSPFCIEGFNIGEFISNFIEFSLDSEKTLNFDKNNFLNLIINLKKFSNNLNYIFTENCNSGLGNFHLTKIENKNNLELVLKTELNDKCKSDFEIIKPILLSSINKYKLNSKYDQILNFLEGFKVTIYKYNNIVQNDFIKFKTLNENDDNNKNFDENFYYLLNSTNSFIGLNNLNEKYFEILKSTNTITFFNLNPSLIYNDKYFNEILNFRMFIEYEAIAISNYLNLQENLNKKTLIIVELNEIYNSAFDYFIKNNYYNLHYLFWNFEVFFVDEKNYYDYLKNNINNKIQEKNFIDKDIIIFLTSQNNIKIIEIINKTDFCSNNSTKFLLLNNIDLNFLIDNISKQKLNCLENKIQFTSSLDNYQKYIYKNFEVYNFLKLNYENEINNLNFYSFFKFEGILSGYFFRRILEKEGRNQKNKNIDGKTLISLGFSIDNPSTIEFPINCVTDQEVSKIYSCKKCNFLSKSIFIYQIKNFITFEMEMVVKKNLVEFSPNSCTIFINYDYWFLLTFFIIIFISFFGFFSTLCLCFSIILVFYLYYARKKLKTENKRKKSILEINLMAIGVEEEKEFNFNKILFLNQIKFSDLKDLIGKLFFLIFFNF
jgi:hypothetical protein